MKLINKNIDYAIRALSYIGENKKRKVPVSEIANKLKIPYPFLRKILQRLHAQGMLESHEGRDGGFNLALPLDEIFLVDMIQIFQGPVRLSDCLLKKKVCPDENHCLLKKKIEDIEKLVIKELKSVTLSNLFTVNKGGDRKKYKVS